MARSKGISRTVKGIGIGIAALIVVVLLVVAFFPWNSLHGSLFWHPHVQVSGLTIGNPAWAGGGQMVSIQRIDLQLRFWPLLRGEIVLPRVALIRPVQLLSWSSHRRSRRQ